MGQGYVRADVANDINDGNTISAAPLDAEFDLLKDAFALGTGHSHDGTTGEGGPINTLGPTQDVLISATEIAPKTNNVVDIGKTDKRIKNFYLHGSIIANDGVTSRTLTHDNLVDLSNLATFFTTRAAFVSWAATAVVTEGTVIFADEYAYQYDGTSTMITDLQDWKPIFRITPKHFGATGDGSTDDTTACQAWATYLRTVGGHGYVPTGTYKVSTLYMHPEKSFTIEGAGSGPGDDGGSEFLIANTDRAAVGLKFTHTDGTTRNTGAPTLRHLRITADTGTKACLMEHRYVSGFIYENITFIGYHGASGLRLSQVWNSDGNDISVWGCGHNVPYKDVGTTTFSISSGGTTLTASGATFAAGDVGRTITLFGTSHLNQTFTISAYTNTTTVTVSEAAKRDYTTVRGTYGGVRGSTTASSTTLTLEADRLTSDDVGRVVHILGAGLVIGSTMIHPHRATITAVSGTSITLDTAAVGSVTNAELIFDPAVEVDHYDTNDISISNLHIEQYRGTGLVAAGICSSYRSIKIHATGSAYNSSASNIQALFWHFEGVVNGRFEQTNCGNLGRIIVSGCSAGISPTFEYLEGLGSWGKPFIYANHCASAVITIGDLRYGGAYSISKEQFAASGTAYFRQTGVTAETNVSGVYYPAYSTLPTWLSEPTPFTPTLLEAGDLSFTYSTQTGIYTRQGRRVDFSIQIVATANAYTTTSGEFYVTGLPVASATSLGNQIVTVGRYQGLQLTGAAVRHFLAAEINANTSAIRFYECGDGIDSYGVTKTQVIAGGTVRISLAGHYFTD